MTKYELFKGDMVRAFLNGTKNQTRRPIKPQPIGVIHEDEGDHIKWNEYQFDFATDLVPFAKYQIGDIMGIRERARLRGQLRSKKQYSFEYAADKTCTPYAELPDRIRPIKIGHCVPNGCFKELVRLFYKVVGVRAEQFCDISQKDAKREGVISFEDQGRTWHRNYLTGKDFYGYDRYVDSFHSLIDLIYPGQWESWVFVYDLEKCEKGESCTL